jgi:hypothetical protein
VLIGRVRGRVEGVFGAFKRSYGLARLRHMNLARNATGVLLTLTGWNLARAADRLRPIRQAKWVRITPRPHCNSFPLPRHQPKPPAFTRRELYAKAPRKPESPIQPPVPLTSGSRPSPG